MVMDYECFINENFNRLFIKSRKKCYEDFYISQFNIRNSIIFLYKYSLDLFNKRYYKKAIRDNHENKEPVLKIKYYIELYIKFLIILKNDIKTFEYKRSILEYITKNIKDIYNYNILIEENKKSLTIDEKVLREIIIINIEEILKDINYVLELPNIDY